MVLLGSVNPRGWRCHDPLKHHEPPARWHSIISWKTWIIRHATVRTSNLISIIVFHGVVSNIVVNLWHSYFVMGGPGFRFWCWGLVSWPMFLVVFTVYPGRQVQGYYLRPWCLPAIALSIKKKMVEFTREQTMKSQRGSRGIALFFNLSTRLGRVVNAMPWPLYPWKRVTLPIVQEAG
jgi:hypothetical protein